MIPTMSADTDMNEIAGALTQTGVVVITDLLDDMRRDAVRSELAPFMAKSRVLFCHIEASFQRKTFN